MKREAGYYWVRFKRGHWIVAEYLSSSLWILTGISHVKHSDFDFKEIDENRLVRD